MTHTVVNHARGEIVVEDTDAPLPEEMCYFATNHVEAKRIAIKRWMRKKCGGKLPCVGEWDPYVREFQWRKWFDAPYVPLLVDTIAARERAIQEASHAADAAEARAFREANAIGPLDSDDEL